MAKFNAVLMSVFLVGLLIASFVSHSVLHGNARDEVIRHADLMMGAALAIRGYTIREIKPLLVAQLEREFLPQSVPSYAATENFHALQKNNPEYMYKEATLNPTNPRNKAMDWESDIIM
jgi:protein-histidine pros-kinase